MRTVKYIGSEDNKTDSRSLHIDHVLFYKERDIMLIVLNNCDMIKAKISDYELLKGATQEQLEKVEITFQNTALRWPELDEDLSLAGFLKDAALNGTLERIESIKLDPRPSEEKVVFMCVYLNIERESLSRQRAEEEIAMAIESYRPMKEKYENIFKSFDIIFMPVRGDQETKTEIFLL